MEIGKHSIDFLKKTIKSNVLRSFSWRLVNQY